MKKAIHFFILGLLIILSFNFTNAQDVQLEWVKGIGGTNTDQGYSITLDDVGNVYTTGWIAGNADFDPGPGVSLAGGAFVSKFDASGNFIWVQSLSGKGYSIAVDIEGNVYTTGKSAVGGLGGDDVFVSKLDSLGNTV